MFEKFFVISHSSKQCDNVLPEPPNFFFTLKAALFVSPLIPHFDEIKIVKCL